MERKRKRGGMEGRKRVGMEREEEGRDGEKEEER